MDPLCIVYREENRLRPYTEQSTDSISLFLLESNSVRRGGFTTCSGFGENTDDAFVLRVALGNH